MNTKHKRNHTDEELIERASTSWLRYCKRSGSVPTQPSKTDSTVEGDIVTLRNVWGELARYRYFSDSNRLRHIESPRI